MIAWINCGVLVVATLLTVLTYMKSAGPAALEKKIGLAAYKICTRYRFASGILMGIASINYVVYFFCPLPLPLPRRFPWPWWVSALIALVIAIPSGWLWMRGMLDAGKETMLVKREHGLFGGIYKKIRHPQMLGELPFWWVFAFALHSPFLALYSLVWIPGFLIMTFAEERDLPLRYGEAYEAYRNRTGAFFPKRQ